MKNRNIMRIIVFIIGYVLSSVAFAAKSPDRLESKLRELDSHLEIKESFDALKQSRIDSLRACLPSGYHLDFSLFEEYRSFKYDSAYFYADRAMKAAQKEGDTSRIEEAKCAVTFCYMSSGLFKEAFDMIEAVEPKKLPLESKIWYYNLYNRLYFDLADYGNATGLWEEYLSKGRAYADTLMAICPPDSYDWKFAQAQVDIKEGRPEKCLFLYKDILNNHDISDHDKAIVSSSIGGAYKLMNQQDSAAFYLAESAIWDIRSATKETTALYLLAELLCQGKEDTRSYLYIHEALADADFYNARHRKLSINPILPVIEKARMDSLTRNRNLMILTVVLCVLSVVLLVFATMIFLKQNKQLKRKSRQLEEASRIKDEYIGHSFYVNSEFIAETEELYKTIQQKVTAHQYEDLMDISRLSKVNKRRESMYASFDKCFLKIFPTFVEEYAKLFPEGMVNSGTSELTPEMRIFALLRLGITDSERVARFLNYSIHTIYTYKTRVKNKSIVSNEEFERCIKAVKIGK